MKTPTNSKNRPGRHLLKIMKGLLPLLAAGTLVSCGTQSVGTSHTNPATLTSGHRLQVQHQPRTDIPKRAPADGRNLAWERSFENDADSERTYSGTPVKTYPIISW